MSTKEKFLSKRKRYHSASLSQEFSDEKIARDWTLSKNDREEIGKYRKNLRLYIFIQLCAVSLYSRFLAQIDGVSPRIIAYLSSQLELPPSLTVEMPEREATYLKHRKNILNYLGFHRFDDDVRSRLQNWIEERARKRLLPGTLFPQAECLTTRFYSRGHLCWKD